MYVVDFTCYICICQYMFRPLTKLHLVNVPFNCINPLHVPVRIQQIFEERFSTNYCGRNAFHLLLKVTIKTTGHLIIKLFHFIVVPFAFFTITYFVVILLPQCEGLETDAAVWVLVLKKKSHQITSCYLDNGNDQ